MAHSLLKRAEGGNKGEERGFARRGRHVDGRVPKRRKKGGGSGTGTRARIKSGPEAGKRRSVQCTRTTSVARCRGHARIGANGLDTDNVRRARGDSDLACDRGRAGHSAWDLTSTQAFLSTPYYPRLTFPMCCFLPFLVHNMRQPLYEVRSQHTCFLRNHLLLFTLREHYFINSLWISHSNTQIFVSKVV